MSDLLQGQAPGTLPQAGAVGADEPEVFDRAYVRQLRSENAAARVKLKEFETAETARKQEADAKFLTELGEVEALKNKLADAEGRAAALERLNVRAKAAAVHSLPADLHEFITADDEAGAMAQAEKLAAKLKPAALPPSGKRNPANGSEAGVKADEFKRLENLARRVPGLGNRILRG